MKKIISTILSLIMLLTAINAFSVFADGEDTSIEKVDIIIEKLEDAANKDASLPVMDKKEESDQTGKKESETDLHVACPQEVQLKDKDDLSIKVDNDKKSKFLFIKKLIRYSLKAMYYAFCFYGIYKVFFNVDSEFKFLAAIGVSPNDSCEKVRKVYHKASVLLHDDKTSKLNSEMRKYISNFWAGVNSEYDVLQRKCRREKY